MFTCTPRSKTMYIAAAENYLLGDGVLQKLWDCLEILNQETEGGLRHARMKKDTPLHKRASLTNKKGEEFGFKSEVLGRIVDNPRKVRGSRLDMLLFEECFGKGTRVIMSDYSIKNIEDIKVGEFVLGIDGKPKEVMRTCTGIDDLYLVDPYEGDSYVVNSKHKLYTIRNSKVELITAPEILENYYHYEHKGVNNSGRETNLSIHKLDKGEYFGITLRTYGNEKTDNLFLLEDFTIVHNCGSFPKLITTYNQTEALVNILGKKIGTRMLWGTGGVYIL